MPTAQGYCMPCAKVVHQALDKEFPFEVVDGDGLTLQLFRTRQEASDYVYAMHGAIIITR